MKNKTIIFLILVICLMSSVNAYNLTYSKIWFTNTIETITIHHPNEHIKISLNCDKDYLESRRIIKRNVETYENKFKVKNKIGKTNITFVVDGIQQIINIEIKSVPIDEFVNPNVEDKSSKLNDFLEDYGWVIIIGVALFFVLILILAFITLFNNNTKKEQ